MNQEQHSFSTSQKSSPPEINLDEFMISEENFKPMTKGLGFHQDLKKPSFKPAPREVKPFGVPNTITGKMAKSPISSSENSTKLNNHIPSGLEAFYGQAPSTVNSLPSLPTEHEEHKTEIKPVKSSLTPAPAMAQITAWIIDLLVIASFVAITGTLLVLASGIELQMYSRLISFQDLMAFTAAIFSIYYLLYFTILDLSASPGKTIFGLRVIRNDGRSLRVKHTFSRAFISLISGIALFLPLTLDFQGRLSDTKVVK